jgi:voltage-gated sodium channel
VDDLPRTNPFGRLAAHPAFGRAVLALIAVNALLVGVETAGALVARHPAFFAAANATLVAAFCLELAVRLAAHGRRPHRFLASGWNVFDLAVVLLALVPAVGPLAGLARLARILRVLRLVSAAPKLRLIVNTMLRSLPSLGHVSLLLGLLLYVYAVMGVALFGAHDPAHWGSLGAALLTLFQVLTLEGWVELMAASRAAGPLTWLYYVSFVVLAVFVVVNLFVAVVLSNLEDARDEEKRAEGRLAGEPDFDALRAEIDRLEASWPGRGGRPRPRAAGGG